MTGPKVRLESYVMGPFCFTRLFAVANTEQVSDLISHEDARATIQLSVANQDIALSTKKDSTAMKTVAVMTMVFLPATFFAALFAVPTLKWDEDTVVQKKFYIYFAFTLPT